ncbi:ornithine decarboxylase antizyme-domain-containing protein [Desarmillaria tabescens]|uniref:Ornithine decarboxylase antizyme n=1 Tax=Armillaria tabescens TaxID=1929756 RepID=A0AA39N9A5_ARMTA|nr:ornithine decarboxylase antizyme-domain-containing protein [Desarmillaria tabescens]KAK0461378.1 ornithine decarboxylase antizyme-domain-containing protein [Desarmillaria tabescens]
MSNFTKRKSSLCPTNGRQTVGDGASFSLDTDPSVLAVCQMQGTDDLYYYSTTFSGGPGTEGSPASILSSSPTALSSSPDSNYINKHIVYPHAKPPITTVDCSRARAAVPVTIPTRSPSVLSTPPLTPDDGSDCSANGSDIDVDQKDALDFVMTIFPRQGLKALPYAKRVTITASSLGSNFSGMVLELPGKPKTLYVDGKSAQSVSLRESVVALLDLADEQLACSALVIVLERSSPTLGQLLHSLMYVGGSVVTKPPFEVDPAFVLVGLDI